MANDYVKYFTVQAVSYMNTTKEERLQKKEEKSHHKESLGVRWFGMVPTLAVTFLKTKWTKTKTE